ncbi:MAG: class I SAM-dependent methyltransferase [Acidimicrobiales bacterium]
MSATSGRTDELLALARRAKGFMPDDEGLALYHAARRATVRAGGGEHAGTIVEVGAWCGKSTIYLGAAAEESGATVFSIDHHHGSEENQAGWEHHDTEVVDPATGRIDTLPFWRRAVDGAGLGHVVVGMVGDSPTIAAHWRTPVDFCFIDGGHGAAPAWADYRGWAPHVAPGALLAIHDVFPNPEDGGRPPYELWCAALESGEFAEDGECGSLRVLRRVAPSAAAR